MSLAVCSWSSLIAALILSAGSIINPAVLAATLVADYRLEGSLKSTVGTAPELKLEGVPYATFGTADVLGAKQPVLTVGSGGGVQIDTTGLVSPDQYTIVAVAALDVVAGYHRFLDVNAAASARGWLVFNGGVVAYPAGVTGTHLLEAGKFAQVAFTKSGTSAKAYVNGAKDVEFDDSENWMRIGTDGLVRILREGSGSYAPGGRIARIRVYQGAMTEAEIAALDMFAAPTSPAPSGGAVVADYRFEGTLKSSVGGAGEAMLEGVSYGSFRTNAVLGLNRQVFTFNSGGGLRVATQGLLNPDRYSIVLTFEMDTVGGYQRIFDVKEPSDTTGAFSLNGVVGYYPYLFAPEISLTNDTYVQLTYAVDGKYTRIYQGATKILEVVDPSQRLSLSSNVVHFFRSSDGSYGPGGSVARIRLWNAPLTDSEVAGLSPLADLPPPAPATPVSPTADYRFEGTLKSSVAGAPELVLEGKNATFVSDTVGGVIHPVLQFDSGSGLGLSSAGLVESDRYTAVMLFQMNSVGGYQRVLEVKNPAETTGLFILNGRAGIHPLLFTADAVASDRTYVQLALVVEGQYVRLYRDGTKVLDMVELNRYEHVTGNWLHFLRGSDGAYAPGGRIARIRTFNAALNESQIAALQALAPLSPPVASGGQLVADYQFQDNFNSSVAGAPAIAPTDQNGTFENAPELDGQRVYRFNPGQGLRLATKGLVDPGHYTLAVGFEFDSTGGYNRLLDVKDPTETTAWFILNGEATYLSTPYSSGPLVNANSYIELVVVTDGNQSRLYANGKKKLTVYDGDGRAVIGDTGLLTIFRGADGQYAPGGRVTRVRLYNGALNDTEVMTLVPSIPTSEPGVVDWDAARDLRRNEIPYRAATLVNPNPTVPAWTYGYRPQAEVATTNLTLYSPDQHYTNFAGSPNLSGWARPTADGPSIGANIGSAPVILNFCCGPLVPIQTSELGVWPSGDGFAAVVRWIAPEADEYAVAAYWHKTDINANNGSISSVVVNGKVVYTANWFNADQPGYTNTLVFAAGDKVDFVLAALNNYTFGGTAFSARITARHAGTPSADLLVESVQAPAVLRPGVPANIVYKVVNAGTSAATPPWVDAIYLTPDPQGSQSFLLGAVSITEPLAAGASLVRTQQVVLPANGPSGSLQVVVATDAGNALAEANESNNSKAAETATAVAGTLTLTVPGSVAEDAVGGNLEVTISRNGDVTAPLVAALLSSDPARAGIPASVTIPAGRATTSVFVTIARDGLLTGPKKVVFTASAAGFENGTAELTVLDADIPKLTLSFSPVRIGEGSTTVGTLVRQGPVTSVLNVSIAGPLARLDFPAAVTIPSGQASVTFPVASVENTTPNRTQTNLLTASADGYLNGTAELVVDDNDVPSLSLLLARSTVSEGDGPQATTATVTRDRLSPRDLVIHLSSGNSQVARVPASVTIPAGESSAVFNVAVTDNAVIEGDRLVAIGATLLEAGSGVALTEAAPVSLRVTDDDGPSLKLTLGAEVVAEGASPATTATVARNGSTATALTVALASSDTIHVKIPANLVIPAGAASAAFAIDTIRDAANSGNQAVLISAGAAGFTGASRTLVVSDSVLPDLLIALLTLPPVADSDSFFRIGLRLENRGPAPSGTNFIQRVYLSSDALLSSDDALILESAFTGSVGANGFFEQTLQGRAPEKPGDYWVIAVADADHSVAEISENNNVTVAAAPLQVRKAYSATVVAGVKTAPANTPVPLQGKATLAGTNTPASFVTVDLTVRVRETERHIAAITDSGGNFSTVFQPLPGEGGIYSVAADYPGITNSPVQATFTLLGMSIESITGGLRIGEGATLVRTNAVQNLADAPLLGMEASVVSAPAGITIAPTLSSTALAPNGSAALRLQISAAVGAGSGPATIRVRNPDGIAAELTVAITVELARARLVATPEALETGMRRGGQTTVQLVITNQGTIQTGPLSVLAPVAAWLKVASGTQIPSLAPGGSASIALLLTPPAELELGPYTGNLIVKSDTTGVSIPFSFRNLSDNTGNLALDAVDEYTYYAAGSPKLTNAFVTIRDAVSKELVATNSTGANGTLLVRDLKEAYYDIEVTAEGHSGFRRTLLIEPGKDNRVTAFLSRQTVRYIFSVVPTEIEDRTKIVITTEFETFVPIPVVTVDPPYFDFSGWSGSVTQVNVTLQNHGLLAANNMRLALPSAPDLEFTSLISRIGDLPAQSSLTIPIVIKRIPTAGRVSALAAGGSCYADASFDFDLVCGPQVNTYNVPLRFDKLGACPQPLFTVPVYFPPFNYGGNSGPGGAVGGGGGCEICFGNGPQVFAPPTFTSPPKNCDPCLAGIGLAAACIGTMGPQAGFSGAKCAMGFASCGYGLATKGADASSAADCMASLADCVREGARVPMKIPKCLLPAAPCLPPRFGGGGGGGAGGSGNEAMLFRQSGRLSAQAEDQTPDEAAPLIRQLDRALALLAPVRYFFGTDAWLPEEADEAAWTNWFGAFAAAIAPASPGGRQVSPAELVNLMALPVPIVTLQPDDVRTFIARWNRTMDYYTRGIFTKAKVAAGESIDFIDTDMAGELSRLALEANEAAVADGFSDPFTAVAQASNEFVARANSAGGGSCAKVKLQIEQEAVITRDGFNATLEVANDTDDALTEVAVELVMRDTQGNDSTRLFFVRAPVLQGLSAVNGTGQIGPRSSGKASWILIPTSEAAPEGPVTHLVGGTLRYLQGGTRVTVPLVSESINVLPNASLSLKYFHQRDVFADDPFTDEVEPSVPFSLAVMIQNTGKGAARNVRITSAQPKIIENKKGLLIDFSIIATDVNGQPLNPALNAAFGDINPGELKIGRWLLKSSLQGLFTDYSASFENVDGLGDKRVALIQSVEIHEMDHIVQADRSFEDGRPDFLANDVPDFNDYPDTLHLSQGTNAPVTVVTNATVEAAVSAGHLTIAMSAPMPSGWAYLRVPDPGDGQFRLKEVRRADGSVIAWGTNVWVTDRTFVGFSQKPVRENIVHLLDYNGAGAYQMTYEPALAADTVAPTSTVEALAAKSATSIPVTWGGSDDATGSGIAYYDIYVAADGGAFVPWLTRTETQGALYEGELGKTYAFYSVATDAAGNQEAAPATADASTLVSLVNTAPVLTVAPDQAVNEGETVVLNNSAADADIPANTLTWTLGSTAPAGALIDPATGRITWATSEATGPSTNLIPVLVRDNGQPPLSATGFVTVVVREMNTAPVLQVITNRVMDELQTLRIQAGASDADLPANSLSFALVNPPRGAAISTNGLLTWRPDRFQGPSTNDLELVVTDNGIPPLSATRHFTVIVRDSEGDFDFGFESLVARTGGDYALNVVLNSGLDLTRLTCVMDASSTRVQNLRIEPIVPEVASATLVPDGLGSYRLEVEAAAGQILQGNRAIALLRFDGGTSARSEIVYLNTRDITAVRASGQTSPKGRSIPGRVVLVGQEPALAIRPGAQPWFELFGVPGTNYRVEQSPVVGPDAVWSVFLNYTQTNLMQTLPLATPGRMNYYRLRNN